MAKALQVFRDTAVEVEEQRLRERQVVLDTIDYGVVILDHELRVRMYNRAFRDLWELPDEVLRARHTLEELLLAYGRRGLYDVPEEEWGEFVARRLGEVRTASTPPQEWHRPDGRVLQYEVVALPDGGRMLTYFDLTRLKRAEEALVHAQKMAALGQVTAGIAHERTRSISSTTSPASRSNCWMNSKNQRRRRSGRRIPPNRRRLSRRLEC